MIVVTRPGATAATVTSAAVFPEPARVLPDDMLPFGPRKLTHVAVVRRSSIAKPERRRAAVC